MKSSLFFVCSLSSELVHRNEPHVLDYEDDGMLTIQSFSYCNNIYMLYEMYVVRCMCLLIVVIAMHVQCTYLYTHVHIHVYMLLALDRYSHLSGPMARTFPRQKKKKSLSDRTTPLDQKSCKSKSRQCAFRIVWTFDSGNK